jgi:isopenicillin-N N-acyltransferase like protein
MDPKRLLTLKLDGADPQQWGRQHGEAFRRQIRELVDIRRGLLVARMPGWSVAQIDRLCDDQLAAMEQRWTRTLAEVRGIADGSGVSLRDIVILNAYTDLKDFDDAVAEEGGCSLLAAKGPRVNFAGQTWDMHGSAEPYTLLLEIPQAQVPVRVLTLTGCLALSGVNDWGVAVLINDLHCAETSRRGLIWPGLVRLILEQPRASAARRTLATNLPSSGHNYLISDRAKAINVETTGRRCGVTAMLQSTHPGYIAHTNHYLGELVKYERTGKRSPTTEGRLAALQAFFAAHPIESLTVEMLFREFFESGPLCDKTCIPGSPTDPRISKTCAGIAVDYTENKAYAWRGRYDRGQRIEWSW